MEAAKKKVMGLFAKQDNVINLFLAGVFAALSWRSHMQQEEIDALEAEKLALTSGNQACHPPCGRGGNTSSTSPRPILHLPISLFPDFAPSTARRNGLRCLRCRRCLPVGL
ncbi:hypothetical protein KSP40_PGU019825 [Platanthera guangdongensis]|uniref:Uncharacterized protein n=1 Tax=Platanthera guangdongensis TaxID=2320717 RepID=A0ABR2LGH0_9ASPA